MNVFISLMPTEMPAASLREEFLGAAEWSGTERRCIEKVAARRLAQLALQRIYSQQGHIEQRPTGQPYFMCEDGEIYETSWSHCHGYVAAVVSRNPIGVDIEASSRVLAPRRIENLVAASSHPNEHNVGQGSKEFLRSWVVKEALVKAAGVGILAATKKIHLEFEFNKPVLISSEVAEISKLAPWVLHYESVNLQGGGVHLSIAASGEKSQRLSAARIHQLGDLW